MTDINEHYTPFSLGSYIFPDSLNITDINNSNFIIKEIEGNIYYSSLTDSGSSIFSLLDSSSLYILQNNITGSNGHLLNVSIISAISFPNASLDSDFNNAIAYDFKSVINTASSGFVVSLKPFNINNHLVIFFTLAFKFNPPFDSQLASDFFSLLSSNSSILSMFNSSHLIKFLPNFTLIDKYPFYDSFILKKNINFYLIDVTTSYLNNDLTISIHTIGLYHKWSFSINDRSAVIVYLDTVHFNILLSSVFKLYIKFYNKSFDIIADKLLFIDPNTNLVVNTHSIFNSSNTFVISVLNNSFYINNIQQHSIFLVRGQRYIFDQSHSSNCLFPLSFFTSINIDISTLFLSGVSFYLNNILKLSDFYLYNLSDFTFRHIEFIVPLSAPNILYYNSLLHMNMGGLINIIN